MSGPPHTIGLPSLAQEAGERRAFLPEFVQQLTALGADVYLEAGYGAGLGQHFDNYRLGSARVHSCSREESFQQELVLVLRAPDRAEFALLQPGAILFSMLHFATRPGRVQLLQSLGLHAISMDGIVNDDGLRLVENMPAVAWNGLAAAFTVLEEQLPGLRSREGRPVQVLILGAGMLGRLVATVATKLGSLERSERLPDVAVVAQVVGRNVTAQPTVMRQLFESTDILVDATARRDPARPVVPNLWLQWLPQHSVIADLAVDPYLLNEAPVIVRGIEGIPQGNLDQYVFKPQDPAWTASIPDSISSTQRRTTVTCYSWPGIYPEACMRRYAHQLVPLMEVLFEKGYASLSLQGGYFERALCRGTLKHFLSEA